MGEGGGGREWFAQKRGEEDGRRKRRPWLWGNEASASAGSGDWTRRVARPTVIRVLTQTREQSSIRPVPQRQNATASIRIRIRLRRLQGISSYCSFRRTKPLNTRG